MATNYVFPRFILGYTTEEKDSSSKFCEMFHTMRTSFINYNWPFIFRTEVELERVMRKENISCISEADKNIKEKLFNCGESFAYAMAYKRAKIGWVRWRAYRGCEKVMTCVCFLLHVLFILLDNSCILYSKVYCFYIAFYFLILFLIWVVANGG